MSPDPAVPLSRSLFGRVFGGLFGQTATVAFVVGLAAFGAVHHLARVTAERHAAGLPDPEVTGSIAGAARSVSLDPCTGRERLIVRGPVGRNNRSH